MSGRRKARVFWNGMPDWSWTACYPDGTCDDFRSWRLALDSVLWEIRHGRPVR